MWVPSSFVRLSGALALALGVAVSSSPVQAGEVVVELESRRVVVADLVPGCAGSACSVDLGAAPRAGSSRLLDRRAVLRAIARAGKTAEGLELPASMRLVSRSRAWSTKEWAEHVRPVIDRALPEGVTLERVTAKTSLTLPLAARLGAVTMPRLPRRAGGWNTAATVEVLHDGVVVRRVPTLVRVQISERAAQPDVPRGHGVTLIIQRHTATISTRGLALKDADVGEIAPFRVQRTGRVLKAQVRSRNLALVLDER